jgi:hypothetical protein
MDIFYNEMVLWLFGTAVLFTVFGWYIGKKSQIVETVTATVDSLIKDGYLKTQVRGKDTEILKWREWCEKDVDI